MVIKHDLFGCPGGIVHALRLKQEVELIIAVENTVRDTVLVIVGIDERIGITFGQIKSVDLFPHVSLNVGLEDANLLLVVHQVELVLVEQKEEDLCRSQRKHSFHEAVTTHLGHWVGSEDLDGTIVVGHHEEDGAFLVDNHRLAHHSATLGDIKLLEIAIALIEVGVVVPLLCLLTVQWQGESDGELPRRRDAIENDSVVVLGDKGHIETSNRGHLRADSSLDQVVAHTLSHASLVRGSIEFKLHGAGVGVDGEDIEKHVTLLAFI